MLLESDRSEKRGLETMSGLRANNTAKSAHRIAALFSVVREIVEPALDGSRISQTPNQSAFGPSEWKVSQNASTVENVRNYARIPVTTIEEMWKQGAYASIPRARPADKFQSCLTDSWTKRTSSARWSA